ncbi:phosphate ABC transporter, permease protein PstC [Thermanaerovibrio velox DSM 12556]|uniref:Phosphate transport system permease protein n=1 Tax=Thermanaerovibrio velox DSM 12556 TaxID=926567 RepID=H0UN01_9BACT|nr:phosphate ABC transporter permease subunit PstC [Thermanaerovibrio velox]EHM09280.1 phosphate ABC transporter, permease protein PstC [Thermanaerovibrio velox DSM 12556]
MGEIRGDRVPRAAIGTVAMAGIAVMLSIVVFLLKESLPILAHTTLKDMALGMLWYPARDEPSFGMLPLITGSIGVTGLSALMALPVGVGLGIFTAMVCPGKLRELFKPLLEALGFFPSVVLGFLGMVVIAPWMQERLELLSGLNMLNASMLLGVMILPTVASLTDDSLMAVPKDVRDASYALGATRHETIFKVCVPYAWRGIAQACLLGIMRALGETMVVLMAAGGAAIIPESITDPVRPLTSAIAAEMGETPVGSPHYHALFFMGLILLFATMGINFIILWLEGRRRG